MNDNPNLRMPVDHEWIRNLLKMYHQGATRAICQADLAAETGINKRRVRSIIKELIEQFGEPIGTLYTSVGGYYWITSKGESDVTCKSITDHCISGLARVAALKGITLREYVGQLELGL